MNYFEFLSYISYIYMWKHHKEDNSFWESSLKESSVMGASPGIVKSAGVTPIGKLPFPLMSKGRDSSNAWRESYMFGDSTEE
jgi:hypothetical protein